uniref:Uncharacterized protein n=1 Tax=Arundo donax TaxID=35708 RepID=A0A0A9HVV9_ARUDO
MSRTKGALLASCMLAQLLQSFRLYKWILPRPLQSDCNLCFFAAEDE